MHCLRNNPISFPEAQEVVDIAGYCSVSNDKEQQRTGRETRTSRTQKFRWIHSTGSDPRNAWCPGLIQGFLQLGGTDLSWTLSWMALKLFLSSWPGICRERHAGPALHPASLERAIATHLFLDKQQTPWRKC